MLIEKGFQHTKIHLKKDMLIDECRCMILKGPYGTSVGIFLDESPPEVRQRFEKAERLVREECAHFIGFDAEDVEIIKNSVVWAKVPGPNVVRDLPLRQMMSARILFRFGHVFWNEARISVICFVKNIRQLGTCEKPPSSNFDEWETVNQTENL